jgi:outer membrane biosynthesis protein TonB
MRSLLILAALCVAMPLSAQDPQQKPEDKPAAQGQEQKPPAPPVLEKPGTATEEPAPKEPDKKVPLKKPGTPAEVAKKPIEGANARTVEEIIARVNNEIIGAIAKGHRGSAEERASGFDRSVFVGAARQRYGCER